MRIGIERMKAHRRTGENRLILMSGIQGTILVTWMHRDAPCAIWDAIRSDKLRRMRDVRGTGRTCPGRLSWRASTRWRAITLWASIWDRKPRIA